VGPVKITFGNPADLRSRRKGGAAGKVNLSPQRVRGEDGKLTTVYTIDVHSETLGDDMLTLFRRNAVRARRATRKAMKKHGIAAE
jgi:hypothetical protein